MGPVLRTIHRALAGKPPAFIAGVALSLVALLGLADLATGAELSSSVFYAAPVAIAAWYGSRHLGTALSLAASGTWYLAEIDGLTGLANSRRFLQTLGAEVSRAARQRHPLSLAYIDLDLDGFQEQKAASAEGRVGFPMGVITSPGPGPDGEELVRRADHLMYDVKRTGKRRTTFAVLGEEG